MEPVIGLEPTMSIKLTAYKTVAIAAMRHRH